jgi:hypothetical protein
MNKNKYNFAVTLPSKADDKNGYFKKGFIKEINKYPWLTAAGLDNPRTREVESIEYAGPKDSLVFGLDNKHDITYTMLPEFLIPAPTYDIISEWDGAVDRLGKFAESRKPNYTKKNYFSGFNNTRPSCEVYDAFIKVGYTIIPRVKPAPRFNIFELVTTGITTEITISF